MTSGPTTGELLLNWLSYTREGSWPGFVAALSALQTEPDGDTPARMRSRLSELAHVEFFVGGSRRWRTFSPLVGGLRDSSTAVLAGGRTRRLVEDLLRSADATGCCAEVRSAGSGPHRIALAGDAGLLGATAASLGVPFLPNLAGALAAAVTPVPSTLLAAPPAAAPLNWSVRSFDLDGLKWVDGVLPDTAYEYRSRYGQLLHYLRGPRHILRRLDRRNAVYGAAWLNKVQLLSYTESDEELSVPMAAPMPEPMARAAAASSGTPGEPRGGRLVYRCVPPTIAGVLFAEAGQRTPEPHWLTDERSRR